jgi:hypothetical protein
VAPAVQVAQRGFELIFGEDDLAGALASGRADAGDGVRGDDLALDAEVEDAGDEGAGAVGRAGGAEDAGIQPGDGGWWRAGAAGGREPVCKRLWERRTGGRGGWGQRSAATRAAPAGSPVSIRRGHLP